MISNELPDFYADLFSSNRLELFVAGALSEKEMGEISALALKHRIVALEIQRIEGMMVEFLSPQEFTITKEEREQQIEAIIREIHKSPKRRIHTIEALEDYKFLDRRTYQNIISNPSSIHQLSGRKFEQFIAELLYKRGRTVELTQKTRDGGKDIIVRYKPDLAEFVFYIECKRVKPGQTIGVDEVRKLYGVVNKDSVNGGILITNGRFTKDAWNFKYETKTKICLIDMEKLTGILRW